MTNMQSAGATEASPKTATIWLSARTQNRAKVVVEDVLRIDGESAGDFPRVYTGSEIRVRCARSRAILGGARAGVCK